MVDAQVGTEGHQGETTLTSGVARPSLTEPNKISEIRWKRRVAEQPEDVPYATPAEDPYAKVDEKKRKEDLIAESDDALIQDNVAIQRLMLGLPAIKGDTNGRGGPLLLNEDSFVGSPPEETRLMAVLYKDQRFGHEDLHHGLKPADFVAINAVLVLANTNKDDKLGWSKDGLAGKAEDLRGRKAIDPIESVQDAVDAHITERRDKFERSFDPKDVLTMRGFDACVATALGGGDLMTALRLLEGANRLFPENTTVVADATSRHLPNLLKAYDMYPLALKRQADAVFASMTPGEFQGLLGVGAIVKQQEESTQRLRASAMLARDRWYGAQQACGRPDQLRKHLKLGERLDEALSKNTPWESMVRDLGDETSGIVEAQVANAIAAELARRVHPERTIQAHVQTDIQRSLVDPRYEGPSFDPQYGSSNEYVPVYGANPADNRPALLQPRTINALSQEQQTTYLTKPDRLDVAAFIAFFKSPNAFIGQSQVSAEVATAMAERFVPAMQFLHALVYSAPKGWKNDEVQEIIKRQFGITVDASTTDAAHVALKRIAPTHPIASFGGELMTERNLSLAEDQKTLQEILALVPSARAAELALAQEDLRQSINSKMEMVKASQATAQKYLDDIANAQRQETQAKADQTRLEAELADAKIAKVGKGVIGFGKGKFGTEEERQQAVQKIKDEIAQARTAESVATSKLLSLRGFEDQSEKNRRTIQECEAQIAKLQRLLDAAIPKR